MQYILLQSTITKLQNNNHIRWCNNIKLTNHFANVPERGIVFIDNDDATAKLSADEFYRYL